MLVVEARGIRHPDDVIGSVEGRRFSVAPDRNPHRAVGQRAGVCIPRSVGGRGSRPFIKAVLMNGLEAALTTGDSKDTVSAAPCPDDQGNGTNGTGLSHANTFSISLSLQVARSFNLP